MLAQTDLPLDDRKRLRCQATLQVVGCPDTLSAGDCAAVPDLTSKDPSAVCSPSAQHALRQADMLAEKVIACLRDQALRHYQHRYAGPVASLGLYRGVAETYGIRLTGIMAWFMHRTYHLSRMPTFNRKVRILADWASALLFRPEVVALGQINDPKADFARGSAAS